MSHADEPVKRVGNPERPSLDLSFDPVFGLTGSLLRCNILGRIDLVESHELDETETASRADPASLIISPHKFIDEYKNSCLHLLDVGNTDIAVLGL